MAMYKLHYGTQAAFDAKKAAGTLIADDLYFTSDTALIYKGDMLLSASVEAVTEFPATGAQGRIYVDSETLEAKVWNGSAWVVISPAVETTLDADTATGALVTAGAIRAFIEAQIGSASVVQDVAYDEATQKITVTYGDGSPAKEILLKNLITGVAYDPATGDFTFSKANGDAVVVNTPVENFLAAAFYDADTNTIKLTMESGNELEIPVGDLVDVYTVKSGKAVALSMNGNEITAEITLSAEAGNALEVKEDGLFLSIDALSTALENVYTKDEVYTKEEVDAAIETAKTEIGETTAALDERVTAAEADIDALETAVADVYTKAEVDALLSWQEI